MTRTFHGLAVAAMTGIAALLGSVDDAASQGRIACGAEFYTVRPGDALSEIAQRAYSSFNYQVIFDANQDVLTSPSVLLVGQELFIPCLDGSGPGSKAEALGQPVDAPEPEPASPVVRQAVVAPVEAEPAVTLAAASGTQAVPALDRPVRFLTGSDYAPFTGRDLPEGGMITELVNRAMQRADALRPYRITWENDWSRHLTELLPSGEYDLGFPWFRPDCSRVARLSDEMRRRCTDFDFSQPIYEVAIGYYVSADDRARAAAAPSALYGKRLCRPAGYFTFDLEAVDLVEPNVTMVRPPNPGDCFAQLAAGEVDVVAINALLAEKEIAGRGLRGRVIDIPALGSVETLHVVSARSNPYGQAYLRLIDRGLTQLREEGIWSEVTARHLTEYGKRL